MRSSTVPGLGKGTEAAERAISNAVLPWGLRGQVGGWVEI